MAQTNDPDEVLASIHASAPRRMLGVGSMLFLGGLLIYLAFSHPPGLAYGLFLIVTGGGALWVGAKMYQATGRVIELTRTELRDSTGQVLAPVAEIQRVDRGFFAFKPSNGMLIRTSSRVGDRVWLPGMWWRFGRQIGIGGVTPGSQTKFLSEILAVMIAERDGKA